MRALVLIVLCIAVAVPASAFLVRVNISIAENDYNQYPGWLSVASGGFIFDSEYFVLTDASDGMYRYDGIVPLEELEESDGVDFFDGALAGTHWDILSDIYIHYRAPWPIEGGLGPAMWSWDWGGIVGGYGMGGDGHGFLGIGDYYYSTWWDGGAIGEDDQGEDEQASLPEPPMLPLFAAGATAVLIGMRRRGSALALLGLYLAAATPAGAFPIRVDFTTYLSNVFGPPPIQADPGHGYFIFDTDIFPAYDPTGSSVGVHVVPSEFSFDMLGRHWGLEDVSPILASYNTSIPLDRIDTEEWGAVPGMGRHGEFAQPHCGRPAVRWLH